MSLVMAVFVRAVARFRRLVTTISSWIPWIRIFEISVLVLALWTLVFVLTIVLLSVYWSAKWLLLRLFVN